MGGASSKEEDSFRATLETDPDLQPDTFPSKQGRTFPIPGSSQDIGVLGYEIYGAAHAPPNRTILFMHGTPGTRFFFTRTHSDYAAEHNVRVIVPERPGYGLSTPLPLRTMQDSVMHLDLLLAKLQCERVHVMGYSAGGPFALAFARWYPARCESVCLISSLSPNVKGVTEGMTALSKFGYFLSKNIPWLLHKIVKYAMVSDALKESFGNCRSDFIEEENAYFGGNMEVRRTFIRSTMELYSRNSGADAESEDYVLMAKDWGFELNEISSEIKLFVYGGQLDNKCTRAMFKVLADGLPKDKLKAVEGEDKHHLWFYELFEATLLQDIGLV